MGPDELDDLLQSIREESKRESALALYEGIRETDLVDEDIDERILKLLGLSDVFDIDYGTYITLIKERLSASRSFGKQLSAEEDELLVEEFRKVKGKVGRFKIRKRKITAENIGTTGPIKVSTEKFYLTSKAIIPQPKLSDGTESENIADIMNALDELLKSITDQNKLERKKAEEDRKADEQKRRAKREAELEKPLKKALGLVKKLVAPFQSILDKIMRFIQFTLLGFFVDKVLKWFADPANERKIKILGRFLKDWWPSLAFAAGLFLTPLGAFIRGTIKMLRGFIPQIVKFMAAHPILAAGAITGLAAGAGEMWRQKEEKRQIEREAKQRNVKPEVVQKELREAQSSPFAIFGEGMKNISGVAGGGKIKRRNTFFTNGSGINVKDIAFEGGGGIDDDSGLKITGAGPDTQLIAAQPGEVMMSKKAVDKYGANFFLGLNKRAGGTNIPRMVNNIQLARGGGLINKTVQTFQGGGIIGGLGRILPGTGTVMAPLSGGPTDIQGIRQTMAGYQNKFLGMNIGKPFFPRGNTGQYSQKENRRYYEKTGKYFVPTHFPGGATGIHGLYTPPKSQSGIRTGSTRKDSFVGDAFKNFGQNVQTIKESAKKQEQMMRQMGVEPSGYVNLRGQPINLGPQSRAMPIGTPTIISRSSTVVLPPQTMPTQKSSPPVKTGTQIPDVSIVATIPHREIVIQSLGIGDLMGVV